jgi:hypothetical protein
MAGKQFIVSDEFHCENNCHNDNNPQLKRQATHSR